MSKTARDQQTARANRLARVAALALNTTLPSDVLAAGVAKLGEALAPGDLDILCEVRKCASPGRYFVDHGGGSMTVCFDHLPPDLKRRVREG